MLQVVPPPSNEIARTSRGAVTMPRGLARATIRELRGSYALLALCIVVLFGACWH